MTEKWWHWNWDKTSAKGDLTITYSEFTRWRRGWVTLYKFVSTFDDGHVQTEWSLYLPFNISVSVQFNKNRGRK